MLLRRLPVDRGFRSRCSSQPGSIKRKHSALTSPSCIGESLRKMKVRYVSYPCTNVLVGESIPHLKRNHCTSLYERRWVVTCLYVDISGFTRAAHLVLGWDAQFATKTAL